MTILQDPPGSGFLLQEILWKYKAYGSIVTLWCHQIYGKYDDLWEIYRTYKGNLWWFMGDALWCHQTWLENPRTEWRFQSLGTSPNSMVHCPARHVWWHLRVPWWMGIYDTDVRCFSGRATTIVFPGWYHPFSYDFHAFFSWNPHDFGKPPLDLELKLSWGPNWNVLALHLRTELGRHVLTHVFFASELYCNRSTSISHLCRVLFLP